MFAQGKWVVDESTQDVPRKTLKRLQKSLRPILAMFWLIGIDMRLKKETTTTTSKGNEKNQRCNKTQRFLMITHGIVGIPLSLVCLMNLFEHLKTGHMISSAEMGESAINIQGTANFFTEIVTYAILIIRRQHIIDLVTAILSDITSNLHSKDVARVCRKIKATSIILCLIIIVYLLALGKVCLIDLFYSNVIKQKLYVYSSHNWYSWLNTNGKLCMFLIGEIFNSFFLSIMGVIVNSLFCIILILLTIQLDNMALPIHPIQLDEVPIPPNNLNVYVKRHKEICNYFSKTNEEFGFLLLTWISCKVLGIIFLLRALALDNTNITFLLFSLHVVVFLVICSFSTVANDKLINSLQNVGNIEDSQIDSCTEEHIFEAKTNFQLYCTRVTVSAPRISAWGFFDIDRAFLLAVFGTVLTYVLLLYDK